MDREQREALKRQYEAMPRDQLVEQGRAHLMGGLVPPILRTRGWLSVVIWILVAGAIIGIGWGAVRLLFQAKDQTTGFAEQREQRLHQAVPEDE